MRQNTAVAKGGHRASRPWALTLEATQSAPSPEASRGARLWLCPTMAARPSNAVQPPRPPNRRRDAFNVSVRPHICVDERASPTCLDAVRQEVQLVAWVEELKILGGALRRDCPRSRASGHIRSPSAEAVAEQSADCPVRMDLNSRVGTTGSSAVRQKGCLGPRVPTETAPLALLAA